MIYLRLSTLFWEDKSCSCSFLSCPLPPRRRGKTKASSCHSRKGQGPPMAYCCPDSQRKLAKLIIQSISPWGSACQICNVKIRKQLPSLPAWTMPFILRQKVFRCSIIDLQLKLANDHQCRTTVAYTCLYMPIPSYTIKFTWCASHLVFCRTPRIHLSTEPQRSHWRTHRTAWSSLEA